EGRIPWHRERRRAQLCHGEPRFSAPEHGQSVVYRISVRELSLARIRDHGGSALSRLERRAVCGAAQSAEPARQPAQCHGCDNRQCRACSAAAGAATTSRARAAANVTVASCARLSGYSQALSYATMACRSAVRRNAMGIQVINPKEIALREKKRTVVMNTRKLHAWVHYYPNPGDHDDMHCHNEDQVFTCFEGECTMHFPDGTSSVLRPGMAALITGGSFYKLETR